ncbi:hypothetical protein ANCCAN_17652 [Ancylostoma caninum]|uniref:Uncharacterized protein n=1 Tax=Ancylostoma caninum TaxID=29170 RepID=A0A368FWG3_ANCCA|nr:hypothetical protein ANCCAN_17652 [Ancylostoma caninum]
MATLHFLWIALLAHVASADYTEALEFTVEPPKNILTFKDNDITNILQQLLNTMQSQLNMRMPSTVVHESVEVVDSKPSFTETVVSGPLLTETVGNSPLFTGVVESPPSLTVVETLPSITEVVQSPTLISGNEAIGLIDGYTRRKREAPIRAHRIKA